MFSFSYTIDDLPYDRAYLVSLQIMDCYQTSDPQCLSVDTFTVLERSIIPKALCSWDHSFITTSKLCGSFMNIVHVHVLSQVIFKFHIMLSDCILFVT